MLYAVGKDELRPQMTGVFIEANGAVTMTATNGNVLAHCKVVEEFKVNRENNEIVTADILETIAKIIPDEKEIALWSNSRHQWMVMGDVELCARKLDERYPDWRNAVPKESNAVKIDRRNLLASINRMLLFTDKATALVKSEINLKSISLTADSYDFDHHGHERITLESESAITLQIGLNASQLKEALGHIEQELIMVEYSNPRKPIVLRYEDGFSLLVPLTLASNA